ncbi:MAG TPA: DUF2993 domain-containing protein [Actinomycetota bacterium]|nr:DUF2993 domain-containing protein [Actinomycetota bacterium]
MRKLLIVLLLLVVTAVAGDFLLRLYAEERAGAAVQSSLALDVEPDVSLGGFPFLTSALRGRFDSVGISVDEVTARGVTIEDVDASFSDVRFELDDLLAGSVGNPRTGGGSGTAALTGGALTAIAREQGLDARIRISGGRVTLDGGGLSEEGDVSLDGNELTVTTTSRTADFTFAIPVVVEGVTYRSVDVEGATLVLRFSVEAGTLRGPR